MANKDFLTPSQYRILELSVKLELTQQELADHLVVSIRTVQLHICGICKAYDTSSYQVALVRFIKEFRTSRHLDSLLISVDKTE